VEISPTDFVGSFLKSAHEMGIAALVAYSDTEETVAGTMKLLRIASNQPKAATDGLLGKLGAVSAQVIEQVAKEMHCSESGCGLCKIAERWESLSDVAQRQHLTHVQEIFDLIRLLSSPAANSLVSV
jgi:hypothetical protein